MSCYELVCAYGIGDTYLVASLCEAFKRWKPGGTRLVLTVKESHRDLAMMFPGIDEVKPLPDASIEDLRRVWGGLHLNDKSPFVPHPSTCPVRPDFCVAHHPMSDLAMYAMILGLPPSTIPSLPVVSPEAQAEARAIARNLGLVPGKTVILVPQASSWPRPPPEFWNALSSELRGDSSELRGDWRWRSVLWNDPESIPLRCMIPLAEIAGWVIGTNCGLMQMLVSGRAVCRKTIVTTNQPVPGLPISGAFPYRTMRKVDGQFYDIEEFLWSESRSAEIVQAIAHGRNALGPMPYHGPVYPVETTITPGEALDRLSILEIKRDRLPSKAHLFLHEIHTLSLVRDELLGRYRIGELVNELRKLNETGWESNSVLFAAFDPDPAVALNAADPDYLLRTFGLAHQANRERILVKNRINVLCGAAGREEKSHG